MKPIAFIGSTGDVSWPTQISHRRFVRVLDALGIPWVAYPSNAVPVAEDFSAAIVIKSQRGYSDVHPWTDGKPYPVFVAAAFQNSGDLLSATHYFTGVDHASVSAQLTDATKYTMFDGTKTYYGTSKDSYCYTPTTPKRTGVTILNPGGYPDLEPIMTVAGAWEQNEGVNLQGAEGKVRAWVMDWSTVNAAKSFVLWQDTQTGNLMMFLYFLERAGIVPPRPRTLYLHIDDLSDMRGRDLTGLGEIIAIARAAGTYILCGLNATPTSGSDEAYLADMNTLRDYVSANSDVLKCIVHHHPGNSGDPAGRYWYDDFNFPTVATKLAAFDADVALWVAAGWPVETTPHFMGMAYCPSNAYSTLGLVAMARRGLKIMRGITTALLADSSVAVSAIDVNANTFTSNGHGFLAGDLVRFTTTDALPGGLTLGQWYYVRDVATNTFKVSATYNGTAVDITGEVGTLTAIVSHRLHSRAMGTIIDGPVEETLIDTETPYSVSEPKRTTIQIYEPWSPIDYNATFWESTLARGKIAATGGDIAYQCSIFESASYGRILLGYPKTTLMFHGVNCLKGTLPVTFSSTGSVIDAVGHRLVDGMAIQFPTVLGVTGLTVDQMYYVRDSSIELHTFKVAETAGGAAVTITPVEEGVDGTGYRRAGDNPLKQFLDLVIAPLLDLAGEDILRYATHQDWLTMEEACRKKNEE